MVRHAWLVILVSTGNAAADVDVPDIRFPPQEPSPAPSPAPIAEETPAPVVALQAPDIAFGLLDRMRVAPFHMRVTDEVGSYDHGRTSSVTVQVQASTDCECRFSFYGTLPMSVELETERVLAAGEPVRRHQVILGTADVGVFGGGRRGDVTTLFRVGALLPTSSRERHAWLPSARVGERVLELPRAAGVRTSVSREWAESGAGVGRATFRIEAGIDVATVVALPGNPVHVIPRAGAGMLARFGPRISYSMETAVAADPFADGGLRWSAGITGRFARHVSLLQPAVTIAMVRADEQWGASALVDLMATTAALADGYAE
jgi:hypothetical protein